MTINPIIATGTQIHDFELRGCVWTGVAVEAGGTVRGGATTGGLVTAGLVTTGTGTTDCPQFGQNCAPCGMLLPHFEQNRFSTVRFRSQNPCRYCAVNA